MRAIATKRVTLPLGRIACAVVLGACSGAIGFQVNGQNSKSLAFGLSATALEIMFCALAIVPLLLAPLVSVLAEFATSQQGTPWLALRKIYLRIGIPLVSIVALMIFIISRVKFAQNINYLFYILFSPCVLPLLIAIFLPAAVAFTLTKTAGDDENQGGILGLASWLGAVIVAASLFFVATQDTYSVANSDGFIISATLFFGGVLVVGMPFAWIGGGWGVNMRQQS